jgi:predicted dehydrogenase
MVVDAADAGKDIYVEKPLSRTVADGFRAVQAVRRAKRVCQVGSQRRSAELFIEARRIMACGVTGDVRLVNSWWLNYVSALEKRRFEGKLDWRQWLGPAPPRDPDPMRFFHWHWFYDYGQGYLAQAAHIVDAINMILGSLYPEAVTCMAGKVNVEGAEIPETASMIIQYPENFLAVFTVGYKAMRYLTFSDQLKQFHGSRARFDVGREFLAVYPQTDMGEMRPSIEMRRPGSFNQATRAHIRNFLECVRARADPNATIEMGQATSMALCMAVESMRSGRRLRWNAATMKLETA